MVNQNPKIAILLRDFSGGGAERSMIDIANGLSDMGMDVDLVLLNAAGEYRKYVANSVNIINLNCAGIGLGSISGVLPMARYFRQKTPDKILSTLEGVTLVASFAQMLVSGPPEIVIRVATTFSKEKRPFLRRWLINNCYRKHVGKFVVNSNGSKDNLVKALSIPEDKIKVIYNAVNSDLINLMAGEESKDDKWQISNRFILNIGRLTHAKRQDLLITAFKPLAERSDLDLVILGEGPLRKNLEAHTRALGLQGRVHLPGFVSNPYRYLSKALVFVLSSDYEGMPTVLLEALSVGCPVVSTDCPSGPREILEGGQWGLLTPVGDAVALSGAIAEALETGVDRETLKSRAAYFSIDKLAAEYALLMQES